MAGRDTKGVRHLLLYEGLDEAKVRAWVEMARVYHLICRRVVLALGERGVTMPQFDVLATLRFSEGVSQQELAGHLLVTKGNVCGVLDRLERLGWVERRPDDKDKHSNRLFLTPTGRKKIDALLPQHDALIVNAMRALTSADVKALRGVLEKLVPPNEA